MAAVAAGAFARWQRLPTRRHLQFGSLSQFWSISRCGRPCVRTDVHGPMFADHCSRTDVQLCFAHAPVLALRRSTTASYPRTLIFENDSTAVPVVGRPIE